MKKIITGLIAGATIASAIVYANAGMYSPLRMTVIAYYATNDTVQSAIAVDVCKADEIMDNDAAGSKLTLIDRQVYNGVLMLLGRAYSNTEGTDAVLEAVRDDFCEAVDNR